MILYVCSYVVRNPFFSEKRIDVKKIGLGKTIKYNQGYFFFLEVVSLFIKQMLIILKSLGD